MTSIEQLNQLQPTQNLFEEPWKSSLLFKIWKHLQQDICFWQQSSPIHELTIDCRGNITPYLRRNQNNMAWSQWGASMPTLGPRKFPIPLHLPFTQLDAAATVTSSQPPQAESHCKTVEYHTYYGDPPPCDAPTPPACERTDWLGIHTKIGQQDHACVPLLGMFNFWGIKDDNYRLHLNIVMVGPHTRGFMRDCIQPKLYIILVTLCQP